MRIVKFRGKRFDNGEWIYGSLLDGDIIVSGPVDADGEYIGLGEWCSVHPETMGQLTGLKDKNGKDVYEGDIIRSYNEFGDAFAVLSVVKYHEDLARYSGFDVECGDYEEVIGNIYEHPHLLEAKHGKTSS